MPWSHNEPIAVVGGGIAGLAVARAFQAEGRSFRVFERRRMSADGGLAVNLPGNAIRALAALGLRDEIEQFGHPLRRREYRNASDKLLFEIDEEAFWGDAMRPRSIRRSTLIEMLRTGLPDHAIRYDADIVSLNTSDGTRLILDDGSSIEAALIVGADGVQSRVRAHAFGSTGGQGQALLANASWRFMTKNTGIDCWTVWADRRGVVLLMPVGDEVYGWAALTRSSVTNQPSEALADLVDGFPARVRDTVVEALSRPGAIHHSPLEEVRVERWAKAPFVLIGDAAHATAPVWAEGIGLALEDALVLAECLSINSGLQAALERYELRRRPRVNHVQAMTDAMSKAAKLPNFFRDILLPRLGPKRYRQTYEPLKAPI